MMEEGMEDRREGSFEERSKVIGFEDKRATSTASGQERAGTDPAPDAEPTENRLARRRRDKALKQAQMARRRELDKPVKLGMLIGTAQQLHMRINKAQEPGAVAMESIDILACYLDQLGVITKSEFEVYYTEEWKRRVAKRKADAEAAKAAEAAAADDPALEMERAAATGEQPIAPSLPDESDEEEHV